MYRKEQEGFIKNNKNNSWHKDNQEILQMEYKKMVYRFM